MINDTSQTFGINLALFADNICLYATDRKEGYILRKIQHRLNAGILKSMKTTLGRFTSFINIDA
jgi:hypothetical protein